MIVNQIYETWYLQTVFDNVKMEQLFRESFPEGKLGRIAELYNAKLDKSIYKQHLTSRLVSHRIGWLGRWNKYLLLGL